MSVQKVTKLVTIKTLLEWFDDDKLDFEHASQREGNIWDKQRKQNFIFTLLNNKRYVIPTVYVNEKPSGAFSSKYAVVDGKQRITTIIEFIRNRVMKNGKWVESKNPLKVPKISENLQPDAYHIIEQQGKPFSKLDKDLQNLVLDAELTVVFFQDYTEHTMRNIFGLLQEGVALNQGEKLKALDTQLSKEANRIDAEFSETFERIKPNHKRAYWNKTILHLLAIAVEPNIVTSFKPMRQLLNKTTNPKAVSDAVTSTKGFLSFIKDVVNQYEPAARIAQHFNEVQLIGLYILWQRGYFNDIEADTFKNVWANFIDSKSDNSEYNVETQQGSNQAESRNKRADIIMAFFEGVLV